MVAWLTQAQQMLTTQLLPCMFHTGLVAEAEKDGAVVWLMACLATIRRSTDLYLFAIRDTLILKAPPDLLRCLPLSKIVSK